LTSILMCRSYFARYIATVCVARALPVRPIWASVGAKVFKMGDSLHALDADESSCKI